MNMSLVLEWAKARLMTKSMTPVSHDMMGRNRPVDGGSTKQKTGACTFQIK